MFEFKSKAETLFNLKDKLTKSTIPDLVYFTKKSFLKNSDIIFKDISSLNSKKLIVRSSSSSEDQKGFSNAGAFLSISNIDSSNLSQLETAIYDVFGSYVPSGDWRETGNDEQVMVQSMLDAVSMSGVLFTKELSTGAPYYCINYDDKSGSTDTVTSGSGEESRTLYVLKNRWKELTSERFINLLDAVTEIEELTNLDALDIEFTVTEDKKVMLLQVRPLALKNKWPSGIDNKIYKILEAERKFLSENFFQNTSNSITNILGRMPDWNPAEIIGTSPARLSYSLYRYLITDWVWAEARRAMGYSSNYGQPLMRSVAGHPFIDVKRSFNSFLPATLDTKLKKKLLDHWLSELKENPKLHDKIEFEIAITAWSFDMEDRMNRLLPNTLSNEDKTTIHNSYKKLTRDLIEGKKASIKENLERVNLLPNVNLKSSLEKANHVDIDYISKTLGETISYGTIPFSILARHGFIAIQLIKSLVAKNVISELQADSFLLSVETVASEFNKDCYLLGLSKIDEESFFEKYGHLRPGTYDITSSRYDQRNVESYKTKIKIETKHTAFQLSSSQHELIAELISSSGMEMNVEDLFAYCRAAIEAREYSKFMFTKNLSHALDLIANWGAGLGLTREEVAHLDINNILDLQTEVPFPDQKTYVQSLVERGQNDYEISTAIKLPYIISKVSDLFVNPLNVDSPNFITKGKIRAHTIFLEKNSDFSINLDNKIIIIESADPGFDWIFGKSIQGLITKFGGANSHMAIRCAEFDIPAAIGVGEHLFKKCMESEIIELNCSEDLIEFI
tara:strand:+ start:1769 stop:4141 length:2373 start_codon:yes stop_codon:yes gene_type:complete